MPKRIQRKRTKGWKMPANTIYVGRPTRWGNPYVIGNEKDPYTHEIIKDAKQAVELYKEYIESVLYVNPAYLEELRGKNLACWCKLEDLCHVDIILQKLAFTPTSEEVGFSARTSLSQLPAAKAVPPPFGWEQA